MSGLDFAKRKTLRLTVLARRRTIGAFSGIGQTAEAAELYFRKTECRESNRHLAELHELSYARVVKANDRNPFARRRHQIRPCAALSLSFPRKRKSRISATQGWMPAFAGTTCGADFWSEQRRPRIRRNEKAVKPLKTNNSDEIIDSATIMTSMTYDPRGETLRFAWRNDPRALRALRFVRTAKRKRTWIRLVKGSRASGARAAWRRWRPWAPSRPSFETRCEASLLRMRASEAPRLRSLRQATGRLSRPLRGGSERSPSACRSKPQKVARKRS